MTSARPILADLANTYGRLVEQAERLHAKNAARRDRDRRARPPEARRKTSCRIEESFRLVRSLSLASRYFQVMPWRRITVPMAVLWRGEGGQPHIAPTGDLAGVLQALVTTTITMHHRADILGIPHATSCVPQAR